MARTGATATPAADRVVKAQGTGTISDSWLATTIARVADVNAGRSQSISTKTAAYTAVATDFTILCDATGAAFTVTLPAAGAHTGRIYTIKKIDASANAVTIDADGAELIDGAATKSLATQWAVAQIQSNGTAWYVL